jgi:hypothetical protein
MSYELKFRQNGDIFSVKRSYLYVKCAPTFSRLRALKDGASFSRIFDSQKSGPALAGARVS